MEFSVLIGSGIPAHFIQSILIIIIILIKSIHSISLGSVNIGSFHVFFGYEATVKGPYEYVTIYMY